MDLGVGQRCAVLLDHLEGIGLGREEGPDRLFVLVPCHTVPVHEIELQSRPVIRRNRDDACSMVERFGLPIPLDDLDFASGEVFVQKLTSVAIVTIDDLLCDLV